MGTIFRRYLAAASVLVTMSPIAPWAGVQPRATSAASPCDQNRPMVFGVRGTGDPVGYGPTVSAALAGLHATYKNHLDADFLHYNAAPFDLLNPFSRAGPVLTLGNSIQKYLSEANAGASQLASRLSALGRTCPQRPVVLMGYSQGALVVNRALVNLDASHDSVLGQIAAVSLIADPQRIGASTYLRGTASPSLNGITISLHLLPNDQIPDSVMSKTDSWCHAVDVVCATSQGVVVQATAALALPTLAFVVTPSLSREVLDGIHVHEQYLQRGEARAAGVEAAQRLVRFTTTTTTTTTSPPQTTAPNGSTGTSCDFVQDQFAVTATVNVRAAPNTAAEIVGSVPAGACVTIVCKTSGESIQGIDLWDSISYMGSTAYIFDGYVNPGPGEHQGALPVCS